MTFKKIITAIAMVGTVGFAATSASALEGYQGSIVNPALGTTFIGFNTGCISCHAGGVTTKTTLTTPFYNSYNSGLTGTALGAADSDGDGYTNKQEAIGNSNDFNVATVSPFTKAATASATAVTDTVLVNFVVQGDSAATAQLFTDPYTLATAGVTEVLGSESLTINNAPVDIYYKSAGIDATVTLYSVDVYGQGTAVPTGINSWTANADGSLHVVALPAGAASDTGVVVRTIPVASTLTNIIGDDDDDDDDGGGGGGSCVGGISTTPLMMFLAMLSLAFFTRRKQD